MAKAYQTEPSSLRDTIWQRGRITALELLRICAWKSAAGGNLALLSLNSESKIAGTTAAALKAIRQFQDSDVLTEEPDWGDWESAARSAIGSQNAGTGLLGLEGIGYPTASAILCIANPRAFPVIDRWTVQAVFGADVRPQLAYRAAAYRVFAEWLTRANRDYDLSSIHAVDQRVMNTVMDGNPPPFAVAQLPLTDHP